MEKSNQTKRLGEDVSFNKELFALINSLTDEEKEKLQKEIDKLQRSGKY